MVSSKVTVFGLERIVLGRARPAFCVSEQNGGQTELLMLCMKARGNPTPCFLKPTRYR